MLLITMLFYSTLFSITFDIEPAKQEEPEKIIIAVVDIQKLMEEHPYLKKSKDEYLLIKQEYEKEMKNIKDEIDKITVEIDSLNKQKSDLISSGTDYAEIEADIIEKTAKLKELKTRQEQKAKEYEQKLTAQEETGVNLTMASLYEIIKKIAEREKIEIVVDKSSVLYGRSYLDITEKILREVRKIKVD